MLSSLKSEHLFLKSKQRPKQLNKINHAFNCFVLFTVSDVKWCKNVIKPLLRSVYRYKGRIDLNQVQRSDATQIMMTTGSHFLLLVISNKKVKTHQHKPFPCAKSINCILASRKTCNRHCLFYNKDEPSKKDSEKHFATSCGLMEALSSELMETALRQLPVFC